MYTYTYTHMCIYTYIYMCVYVHMWVCIVLKGALGWLDHGFASQQVTSSLDRHLAALM